jgi:hypothetical protein
MASVSEEVITHVRITDSLEAKRIVIDFFDPKERRLVDKRLEPAHETSGLLTEGSQEDDTLIYIIGERRPGALKNMA